MAKKKRIKRRGHLQSSLCLPNSNFECGGCNDFFDSAYSLHDHMRDHEEGGSYFYNNTTKTAFPVCASTDVSTQTCSTDFSGARDNRCENLVPSISHEDSSDTDNYDDFEDLQDSCIMDEKHSLKDESGTSPMAVEAKGKSKPNKKLLHAKIKKQSSSSTNNQSIVKTVFPTDIRTRKKYSPFTQITVNSNSSKRTANCLSPPIKDLQISLTRIDRMVKTDKSMKIKKNNNAKMKFNRKTRHKIKKDPEESDLSEIQDHTNNSDCDYEPKHRGMNVKETNPSQKKSRKILRHQIKKEAEDTDTEEMEDDVIDPKYQLKDIGMRLKKNNAAHKKSDRNTGHQIKPDPEDSDMDDIEDGDINHDYEPKYDSLKLKKINSSLKKSNRSQVKLQTKPESEAADLKEEVDVSDPDYEPDDDDIAESPYMLDIIDDPELNDDKEDDDCNNPDWEKAKLECKKMKCDNCNKYVDEAFTKANLLALHKIPFQQENGNIMIKSDKITHKYFKGNMTYLKSENDTWEYLSFRKSIAIRKEERSKTIEQEECKECGKMLKSDYLNTHLVKYHNYDKQLLKRPKKDKYYDCEICNRRITRKHKKIHLDRHMNVKIKKSEPEDMKAVCDICGRLYLNERSLLTHMKVHSAKNLTCKHCGYVAASVEERENHKKKHKIYHYCETCGVRCSWRKGLMAHIRKVHLKIRKAMCDICGKDFYSKYSMDLHRNTHFAPCLECGFCGKKFNDPNGLKKHKMIHTGEVRYTCHICNHGFIQSTPYQLHMQKRHSIPREEAMAIHRKKLADEKELRMKLESNWAENLDSIVTQNSL